MNVLSLFDGMSCGHLALDRAGIKVDNYFASEIEKPSIEITQKNYPKTIQLGDVTKVDFSKLPKIDLILAGSPCQDLSCSKEGEGLEGNKSKLFYEFIRAKNAFPNAHFLLENVIPRKKEWKEMMDRETGVEGKLINSNLFVEQNRPRIYWTNIPIRSLPTGKDWGKRYYQWRRTYFRENKSGVCPCLTANMGTGGHNVPLHSMDLKDKLSPNEVEALQGVPADYTAGVSNSNRYKMLGNGWTVDVISHIFKGLPQARTQYKVPYQINKQQKTHRSAISQGLKGVR